MGTGDFPLDAYLDRIGVGAVPSGTRPPGRPVLRGPRLAEVHRAHVVAIPFENLDPHGGVPVSLEPGAVFAKLVTARRGGYCFEQNLLLARALTALGARVELLLGRARVGRPADRVSPRTHLALRVHAEDGVWLCDVGFGNGTLLEPIHFGPGVAAEQSGWRFRIVADGPEHVLQTEADGGWMDLYGFVPEPVPLVDLETSNWFTATHPRSPFVTGLIAAAHRPDGSMRVLSDWSGELCLRELAPGQETQTAVARDEVPELLATRFGLPGFAAGEDGRIRPLRRG